MRILVSLLIAVPLLVLAQDPPTDAPKKKGGGGPPKNLKILKPEEVRAAMASFRVGLGVECTGCHVQGDFASDDKPQKVTARMMITMAREINAKFPDGKDHVTCYTCHRGESTPKMTPPPAAN